MEYLTNWTDTSSIVQTGWSGSAVFSTDCLVFTATNGWHSIGWSLDNIIGKDITLEFDYIFTDVSNWSSMGVYILNGDAIGYLSSLKNLEKTTTEWKHLSCSISSAKKVVGVGIRGNDSTGKSVVMKIANVRIHDTQNIKSSFNKNGIIDSNVYLEHRKGIPTCIGKDYLSATEIYEI